MARIEAANFKINIMEIEEARRIKNDLEYNIAKAIDEYNKQTDTTIQSMEVTYESYTKTGYLARVLIKVEI